LHRPAFASVLVPATSPERAGPANNAMNQTNRGVPGLEEWRASGEPVLAEVGAPFILSLGIAGYRSVRRTYAEGVGA
jgi:hypothetical protein